MDNNSIQREFERSLQWSLIRRAEVAERKRLSMFRQPLSAYVAGVSIAAVVVVFLYALKMALS